MAAPPAAPTCLPHLQVSSCVSMLASSHGSDVPAMTILDQIGLFMSIWLFRLHLQSLVSAAALCSGSEDASMHLDAPLPPNAGSHATGAARKGARSLHCCSATPPPCHSSLPCLEHPAPHTPGSISLDCSRGLGSMQHLLHAQPGGVADLHRPEWPQRL